MWFKTSLQNVSWKNRVIYNSRDQARTLHAFKTRRSSVCGFLGSYLRCQSRVAVILLLRKCSYGDRTDKWTTLEGFIHLCNHGTKERFSTGGWLIYALPEKVLWLQISHWEETWSFRKFATNYLVSSFNLSIEWSVHTCNNVLLL